MKFSCYLLTVEGGPSLGVHVEYAVESDKIASIDRYSGRLLANSIGNTTILASVFVNGNTVICEARSILRVGVPSTIKLHMQSEQLGVGRKLPIYPLFPEGNLFSFYELCKSYRWTIEDEKTAIMTYFLGYQHALSSNGQLHSQPK